MEVTEELYLKNIKEWRNWLAVNHLKKKEAWLVFIIDENGKYNIDYLEAVEEAICFGWIDGIAKKINETSKAQRFSPRSKRSHWSELNKERARKLIRLGKMTKAGFKSLPDLSADSFIINQDIIEAIKEDDETYENFVRFPEMYVRVRISYIQEFRKGSPEYLKRLNNFLKNTKKNKMYGNWNDNGKLLII